MYGLGTLREPTGRPCPAAFLAACEPGLMNVQIKPNQRLLYEIFVAAAAARAEAIREDFDRRSKKSKKK